MAPTPIASVSALLVPTMAMIGIIVSGRAVPDRRQDGPDRALGELELVPEPLDAVGEQLGPDEDDHEGHGQHDEVHQAATSVSRAVAMPTAMTARMAIEMPSIRVSPPRA